MTGEPVLSDEETQAARSLLASAWGNEVSLRGAELIWERPHIVRLRADDGRTAVLKRRRLDGSDIRTRGFGAELSALEFLTLMPVPVSPRLLGADTDVGILLMEDMGPGGSLAHALLGADRAVAANALVSYARALGAMHTWSIGRYEEFADIRARRAPGVALTPHWMDFLEPGKAAMFKVAGDLGLSTLARDAAREIDSLAHYRDDPRFTGLVHSDACPDNTQVKDGTCRIFDFETSGWGPVAIDAAYLLLPFPSCWCFAELPSETSARAMSAYRSAMSDGGIELADDWDTAFAAVLATLVIARGRTLAEAISEDNTWGTTTIRPRVLAWLRGFVSFPASAEVTPRLQELAAALAERLAARWPSARVPAYPALANPGGTMAAIPERWDEN